MKLRGEQTPEKPKPPVSIVGRFTWDDLVGRNPMLAETVRFRRRYLSYGKGRASNNAALGAMILTINALLLAVSSSNIGFPAELFPFFMAATMSLLGPILFHGAIAKERENRTWEMLLVAPVTKAQIVAGKSLNAILVNLAIGGLYSIPMIAALFTNRTNYYLIDTPSWAPPLAMLLATAYGIFVCQLTLFFSARVKRPFTALGSVLGILLSVVLILPALASTATALNDAAFFLQFLNPFVAMGQLFDRRTMPSPFFPLTLSAVYLALSVVCFIWTVKTLTFAENSVRFMPRQKETESA